MITITSLSDCNLFINLSATVSHADYENVLQPVLDELLQQHDNVNICIIFDEKFAGFELHALLDEAQIGIKHWRQWHKIALISEPKWVHPIATALEAVSPVAIEYFKSVIQAELWFQEEDYF